MKNLFITFILIAGTFYSAQAQLKNDSISKLPGSLPFSLVHSSTVEFTATTSGNYSILIEKDGATIDNDEATLSAGETYIIDMSVYPAGTYRIVITDLMREVEYEYAYIKEDETTEI